MKNNSLQLYAVWMKMALNEARKAFNEKEVPVGAVAVLNNKVIARAHNRSIALNDPSAHAEILLLRKLGKKLKNYRLNDIIIVTTLEPCPMCTGALIHARIKMVVFGAKDPKCGACGSVLRLNNCKELNHKLDVIDSIEKTKCRDILQDFFKHKRKKK
ncbi:MAG: tRNA adenosine(34) deaminase TadA [bacterium]